MSTGEAIPDLNLFMMCPILNPAALRELPPGLHVRNCRKSELDIWKRFPFDDPSEAERYNAYMTAYYDDVYAKKGDLFYETCLFVCDADDHPIATCFAWRAYDRITTIHWLKVLREYEGLGIGRALLSMVMQSLTPDEYPVYLHTQPGSFRAIKLYSDFGFQLLSGPVIGGRTNDLEECLPILARVMTRDAFRGLRITRAPASFLEAVSSSSTAEF